MLYSIASFSENLSSVDLYHVFIFQFHHDIKREMENESSNSEIQVGIKDYYYTGNEVCYTNKMAW